MINNMVQRYATIMAMHERAAARGQRLPQEFYSEADGIRAHAQGILNPGELQQAMQAVNTIKAQMHRSLDVQAAQEHQQQVEFYNDRMHQDLTGYRPHQFQQVLKGEKYPVAPTGKRWNKKQADSWAAYMTRGLTKDGQPLSYKQFAKVIDHYNDIKSVHGPDQARKHLAKRYGEKAAAFESFIDHWNRSGTGLQAEMLSRLDERGQLDKDHYEQPAQGEQRRAQILDAWMDRAKHDKHDRKALNYSDELVHEYATERKDGDMQGDIARAMLKLESEELVEARQDYQPEYYNEEDLAASEEADYAD